MRLPGMELWRGGWADSIWGMLAERFVDLTVIKYLRRLSLYLSHVYILS
jgi:hypothetical protein